MTGGYVSTNLNGRKKLPSTLCSMKFVELNKGVKDTFRKIFTLQRNVTIIGEVEEDTYLCYSHQDHSFGTWNAQTNRFRTVNLVRESEKESTNGIPKPPSMKGCIFEAHERYKWLSLHPGCFNGQNCVIFGLT